MKFRNPETPSLNCLFCIRSNLLKKTSTWETLTIPKDHLDLILLFSSRSPHKVSVRRRYRRGHSPDSSLPRELFRWGLHSPPPLSPRPVLPVPRLPPDVSLIFSVGLLHGTRQGTFGVGGKPSTDGGTTRVAPTNNLDHDSRIQTYPDPPRTTLTRTPGRQDGWGVDERTSWDESKPLRCVLR